MKIFTILAALVVVARADAQSVRCRQAFLDNDGLVSLQTFQDAAVVADVNGDGLPDVVLHDDKAPDYSVLLNAGGGVYRYAPPVSRFDTYIDGGGYPLLIDVRDMNGDGRPDLLFTGPVVALGRGDGTFQKPVGRSIGVTSPGGVYVAFADLDGDGILDAAYQDLFSTLILLRGAADGSFTKVATTSGLTGYGEVPILTGDFDGDGVPDLALTDPNSGTVLFKFNNGGFRFSGTYAFGVGATPRSFIAADIDGLGRKQIVAGATGTIYVMTADAARSVTVDKISVDWPQTIRLDSAADLDGDGLVDLVTEGTPEATLGILWARGRRDFAAPVHYSFPTAEKVRAVDVDGDGRPEIVGRKMVGGSVPVAHIRRGTRELDAPPAFNASGEEAGGIAGDLNGDGNVDVVMSSTSNMKVMLGDGHGEFGPSRDLDASGHAEGVGDLDGDGYIDLVSSSLGTLTVWFGRGDGSFDATPLKIPGGRAALIDSGHALVVRTPDQALQEVRVSGARAVASAETIAANALNTDIATAEANGQITIAVYAFANITFYTKSPGGSWQKSTPVFVSRPPSETPIHLADLNGDGRIDFVAGSQVYINGASGFRLSPNFLNESSRAFAAVDVDGDGAPDIVNGNELWHNDGSGNFTRWWVGTVGRGDIFAGDVDHDGKPDLLVLNGSAVVLRGACVQPRIRIAQLGPAYENAAVKVALMSIDNTSGSISSLELRENGVLIHPQMTPGLNNTAELTLYPSLGRHTYTVSFPNVNSETTFTIDVTPHPPRRRAAGK